MAAAREVVITGMGVVSPIGIGRRNFTDALYAGRSGVAPVAVFPPPAGLAQIGGEVLDFDPREHVKPRKSLKVMSREIQLGVTAAELARQDAGLGVSDSTSGPIDPDRLGVVFGSDLIQMQPDEVTQAFVKCTSGGRFDFDRWGEIAQGDVYPLWMLKYLPNMPACHIAIAHDARGPNNTQTLGEVSSLLAIAEAVRVIERGQADVMFSGGTGNRLHPMLMIRSSLQEFVLQSEHPERACRPFDADRSGLVSGEGAAAFVLESREHAQRRGARILARFVSSVSRLEPLAPRQHPTGKATQQALEAVLKQAGMNARDIGHVNAHGLSTHLDDRAEATAIQAVLGDTPVTAPKSFFGNLGSGTGAVEMAASLLALETGQVPVTLNYETPDPACPINVIHGQPLSGTAGTALLLNHTIMGQSVAMIIARD